MPRRKKAEANDTQIIFRVTEELKQKIDNAADDLGISTADWLRKVVEDKFNTNTVKSAQDSLDDKSLEETIIKVIIKMKQQGII